MVHPPEPPTRSTQDAFIDEPPGLTPPLVVANSQDGEILQEAQYPSAENSGSEKPSKSFSALLIKHFTRLFNISPTEWLLRPPAIVQLKDAKECKRCKQEFIAEVKESELESHNYSIKGDGRALDVMALHTRDGEDKNWVLFIPGLHDNYEFTLNQALRVAKDHNVNVLLFNYRGIQESSGEIHSFNDMVDDANLAATFIAENLIKGEGSLKEKKDKIILKGHSLGGAVAGKVAQDNPDINKVFLDRTFTNYTDAVNAYYQDNIEPHIPLPLQPLANKIKSYAVKTLNDVSFELVDSTHYVTINDKNDTMIRANLQFKAEQVSTFTNQEIVKEAILEEAKALVKVLQCFTDYDPINNHVNLVQDSGNNELKHPEWFISELTSYIDNPNQDHPDLAHIQANCKGWIEVFMAPSDWDSNDFEKPKDHQAIATIVSQLQDHGLVEPPSSSSFLDLNDQGVQNMTNQQTLKTLLKDHIHALSSLEKASRNYQSNSDAHTAPLDKEIFAKVFSELGRALSSDLKSFPPGIPTNP